MSSHVIPEGAGPCQAMQRDRQNVPEASAVTPRTARSLSSGCPLPTGDLCVRTPPPGDFLRTCTAAATTGCAWGPSPSAVRPAYSRDGIVVNNASASCRSTTPGEADPGRTAADPGAADLV